jgi:hypothetical protein
MDQVHQDLAGWSEYFLHENDDQVQKLYWAMLVAVAALLIEFVAFFAVLAQ